MAKSEKFKLVRAFCPVDCGINCCGVVAHLKGDRIVKLEPADFNDEKDQRICLGGLISLDIIEDYILEKNSKKK